MSKEDQRNRTVQLLAVNPKYKNRTAYIVPLYNPTTRQYETGFDSLPPIEQGKILKALGVSNDPEKGLQIDELQVPISHRQTLNLRESEDYGIYCLCLLSDLVATSSKKVDNKKHIFFINDVEAESVEDISIKKLQHEAEDLVFKEGDVEKLRSLCVYLGGIDIRKLSMNGLTAKALAKANERPQDVINFYKGKVENKVFILELQHYAVIQNKQGKFYDGETHIGTMEEAIGYVADPKHNGHVSSLGRRLLEKKEAKS